jgi:membrane protease subunit HflC
MRFLATLLITLLVLSAIILPQVLVVVDETELAIITRLGDPQRSIRSAGLYVKAPLIDSVTKFEKRLLIFDAPAESLLTSDKKRLIIDVYARGRITDPLLFFQTVRSVTQARSRVIDIVASELRREIAKDLQLDIISLKREEVENAVRDGVRPIINELGIDVVDVRIKRADFPQAIAGSVYERMKAERKRIADRERAEGAEADLEKRAKVDREAVEIRSGARKEADIIRGEAEAEAIAIFAEALEQDPDFYRFLRSLDAYALFLGDNTTVVLPAGSDLFKFLQSPLLSR